MIRYSITPTQLRAAINEIAPATTRSESWLDRAASQEARMLDKKKFVKAGGPSWSDIKSVYATLQANKCAYCEKELEATDIETGHSIGAIEQDVEHYRPKNPVKSWAPESEDLDFTLSDGSANGYYMLAFNPFNYCVSCKTCNSSLKSNCFPIEGTAGGGDETDPKSLNRIEKPMLIYPIGTVDDDPRRILTFRGFHPTPVNKSGRRFRRAKVTINFFRLVTRETLIRQRCDVIIKVYEALEKLGDSDPDVNERGQVRLDRLMDDKQPHARCARAFLDLFINELNVATEYYHLADLILNAEANEILGLLQDESTP